jgi:hypothetical protein
LYRSQAHANLIEPDAAIQLKWLLVHKAIIKLRTGSTLKDAHVVIFYLNGRADELTRLHAARQILKVVEVLQHLHLYVTKGDQVDVLELVSGLVIEEILEEPEIPEVSNEALAPQIVMDPQSEGVEREGARLTLHIRREGLG